MLRFCFTKINAAETAECEEKMEEKYNYRSILSFFALLARGSIYKILAIFTVLAAAEIISFYRCLKGGRVEGFQGILEGSIIPISAVFLTALSVLFCPCMDGRHNSHEKQKHFNAAEIIQNADFFCSVNLSFMLFYYAVCIADMDCYFHVFLVSTGILYGKHF